MNTQANVKLYRFHGLHVLFTDEKMQAFQFIQNSLFTT